jgi:uncharacterized protein with ParB-like and HNH nuclease domain
MEFPMPEIYVWQQDPDPETLAQTFSIVDGQQRVSTLRQFINNEWALKSAYLDDERKGARYADKFWKDLEQVEKTQILNYRINSRLVPPHVTKDEIRLIFARLNETDRSLNPQELRNATLNGEFLAASATLADSDEMKGLNIFTANDVRRMLDVEFASQLLGYERNGITNDSAKTINELYDKYSNEYPQAATDVPKVAKSLRSISVLFEDKTVRDFFETQNNIYTLHAFLDIEPQRDDRVLRDALAAFVEAYRAATKMANAESETDGYISEYRAGATSRTRSKSSRTQRIFGLRNWIRAYLGESIRDMT